jgi:hypothetical protein
MEHPVKIQRTLQRLKPDVNIKKVSKLPSGDIRIQDFNRLLTPWPTNDAARQVKFKT